MPSSFSRVITTPSHQHDHQLVRLCRPPQPTALKVVVEEEEEDIPSSVPRLCPACSPLHPACLLLFCTADAASTRIGVTAARCPHSVKAGTAQLQQAECVVPPAVSSLAFTVTASCTYGVMESIDVKVEAISADDLMAAVVGIIAQHKR